MNHLIIITGATASGKTSLSIELAERLGCDIISADSRQIYRGIPIGTAAPTAEEQGRVRHHFVSMLDLDATYSAAQYEADVLGLLPELFARNNRVVMCGGSMMYVDAVVNGIDELPTIDPDLRRYVMDIYESDGLEQIRRILYRLDPASYDRIDPKNPRRNIHAVEICLQSGRRCSELLTGRRKQRDFSVTKYYIERDRRELFDRIGRRTRAMIDAGLEDEARAVSDMRHLNSLNTVGYKEMFDYIDGLCTLDEAIARIARNTRVYAKKQLTWLKRDPSAIPVRGIDDIAEGL